MTTENNNSANALIAEFMEFKQYPIQNKSNGYIIDFKDGNVPYKLCVGSLKFHSNWNWLMEVVEKIDVICGIDLHEWDEYMNNALCSKSLSTTYNACIEFIKWYNEQK